MNGIRWDAGAIQDLASLPAMSDMLDTVATGVRDRARSNAAGYYPGSRRVQALITESGRDSQSAYADVGYEASNPGFVLFFSEVGTVKMSARPHLRAALQQTAT